MIMVTYSIKDFVSQNKFTQIRKVVGKNVNGYPYLTFINGNNEAENVYFSINAAQFVDGGQLVTAELLKEHQVVETKNAAGETRLKISLKGESMRLDLADLL